MKVKRKIIEIDENLCDGCGQCVPDCAEGSLQIVDGKARLVEDKLCDGLGACLGACPQGALKIVEREAEKFDEEAVEEFLKQKEQEQEQKPARKEAAPSCPSAGLQSFGQQTPCQAANKPGGLEKGSGSTSALTHWPIQIRLVPPEAPFLKGADLLIAADCTPAAYPDFHQDLLQGRVVMMGCPKFDDQDSYVRKLSEIFRKSGVKSVTIAIMEVPCCGSMRGIVAEALKQSGADIPVQEVVISARGEINQV